MKSDDEDNRRKKRSSICQGDLSTGFNNITEPEAPLASSRDRRGNSFKDFFVKDFIVIMQLIVFLSVSAL